MPGGTGPQVMPPGNSGAPGMPGGSGGYPGMPGMPGSGGPPGMVPGASGSPGMAPPGTSGAPGMMPGGSGYPGMPGGGYPGMPGGSGYPGMPGGGGYPGSMAPGAMGTPGAAVAPPEPKPETLTEKAERVVREGKEKEAFDYLYAAALAEDSSEVLGKYRWANVLKRPAMAVRWGIGVEVTLSPKNYEGSYYPLGTSQNLPERSRRGGNTGNRRGGSTGPGSGMPGGGRPAGQPGPVVRVRPWATVSAGGFPGQLGGAAGGADSELLKQTAGELGDEFVSASARGHRRGGLWRDTPAAC